MSSLVVGVAMLVVLGAVAVVTVVSRGCTDTDRALTASIVADPMFAVAPPGADAGAVVAGPCDEDEDAASAAQSISDGSADALAFYADRANQLGWVRGMGESDADVELCLSRPFEGTTAFLVVDRIADELDVSIQADVEEASGC
ncbi:hypothetical protein IC607_00385 [Cellulomonas sp. JH27-2]|uniref:hypothetical protein n=1 Tax=Cellulomonas sp. JH27-2 TaxID=2774139 RepID=UPI00177F5B92|nr:hypothetical protein [Cellulomonas sp. JH27-2]MBD8057425.1 hypothetical protein [Cellulomonas sp. JH27-2]